MANILLIDDEPVSLSLIANTLRLDGHNVKAMCGPLEALETQGAGQPPIDLLLTDISLEPISGFQLAKRLSNAGFRSPVLFMSSYPALAGAVADGLGDRAILEKPFTARQLRSAVRRALLKSKVKTPHDA